MSLFLPIVKRACLENDNSNKHGIVSCLPSQGQHLLNLKNHPMKLMPFKVGQESHLPPSTTTILLCLSLSRWHRSRWLGALGDVPIPTTPAMFHTPLIYYVSHEWNFFATWTLLRARVIPAFLHRASRFPFLSASSWSPCRLLAATSPTSVYSPWPFLWRKTALG